MLSSTPSCPERDRLLIALTEAAQEYARIADDLAASLAKPDRTELEYRSLLSSYEAARQATELAHKAYFGHRAEHGC